MHCRPVRLPDPSPYRALAALGAFVSVAALSTAALAAGPGGSGSSGGSGEPNTAPPAESLVDPESGVSRPAAPDERTGHVYLAALVGAVGGAGQVGAGTYTSDVANVGYNVGGILGLGIGRYGTVQIFGDFTHFSSPGSCNIGCSGRSFSLGLGVTYHLAQGLAFDPWASFGMGYRGSTFFVSAPSNALVSRDYQGFDVGRIALGGDFYPVSWFGFGPFLEADVGTNLHRPAPLVTLPPNITEGPRAYAFFQVGVRVTFDPMRRRTAPAPARAAGTGPSEQGM